MGVIIDKKLDWKEHVEAISKKASKGIGAVRLCKSFVPLNTLQILYNTLILPILIIAALYGLFDNVENEFAKTSKQGSKGHHRG